MKKETANRILLLTLCSLLLISFVTGMVSAQTPAQNLSKSFLSLFEDWKKGEISANVAKIFFFLIVSLVIIVILTGIFQNTWIVYVLSFLVSFLATAYLTPKDIFSLLNSYTALGLTLTTLIPLIIIGGLTYRAVTAQRGQVQLIMLQWFAWALFALYSIYRFVYDWAFAKEGSAWMNGILLATAIIAALISIFNKSVVRLMMKQFISAETEAASTMLKEVWQIRKAEREAARKAVT